VDGDSSENQDQTEPVFEPLQKVKLTFTLAPRWQHLAQSPMGESEPCDTMPMIKFPMKPPPPAESN
jgi:hypothetical protein